MNFFAACLPGLEPWLRSELEDLGVTAPKVVAGGVEFAGEHRELYRINLCSGLATHVLLRLASYPCLHLAHLRQRAAQVAWRDLLSPGQRFAVRATCKRSKLYHSGAVAERVAQAIAAASGARLVPTPAVGEGGNVPVIAARILDDQVSLSLDTSGEPLHRRGWRLQTAKAPLREDLARALLLAAKWDPATTLVDPMMGAGTIAIEAAVLARRLAPGRLRSFAFEHTALLDAPLWKGVKAEAMDQALPAAPAQIFGSDRDAGAAEAARANAERAGVLADLELRSAPLSKAPVLSGEPAPTERGGLLCNPPHGHRVGDQRKLRDLYEALGNRARRLPEGWAVGLLVADRHLALRSRLELSTGFLTSHGGTKVRAMTGRVAAHAERAS